MYKAIITVEDGIKIGGFGSSILAFANANNYKIPITILGIDDEFVEHATVKELKISQGLDQLSIENAIKKVFNT